MELATEPGHPSDVIDIVGPVVDLVERHLIRDAEVVLAFLTLWLLRRVETGLMTRDQANRVFTTLDARLTRPGGQTDLSDEAQELLFEGEFLHHLGETDGPDPDQLRALAFTILQRAECR
jgi:hypothetical protein